MKSKNPTQISRWKTYKAWFGARSIAVRLCLVLLALWFLIAAQTTIIAEWYKLRHANEPLKVGVTYIADYARYYDLDPKETMLALRDDLGFRRFRLVSYWKNIEPINGKYDFSELDWQFDQVEQVGGEVTLAIGLRQPRWPECHFPSWVTNHKDETQWKSELYEYMNAVIEHVKNRKSLVSYQLENEYFLGVFGECPPSERTRLIEEFELVKKADPSQPVIISLANNYFGIPIGQPRADQFGVSVYKRVWDQTVTKRYFEYPFTPDYYAYRAGLTEIFTDKDSMLHELQAEPWTPVGVKSASIEEQNKSMDVVRLKSRIAYGVETGFRDIDLWGGEWWYWRKVKLNDPSLWNAVKDSLSEVQ
jgi:hypothetical protein